MRITISSYAEILGVNDGEIRHGVIIRLLRSDVILRTWRIHVPEIFARRRSRWSFFYSFPKEKGGGK